MTLLFRLTSTALLCAYALVAPTASKDIVIQPRQIVQANQYAPSQTVCPSGSLVRPATSINSNEAAYIAARKPLASAALASWVKRQGNFSTASEPTIGFISSGGGYRALLCTAGVVQGFDIRDSNLTTSGIYQGLTYESGLSGGAWFLGSLTGNNWPTVTYLKTNLWQDAFQDSMLLPANLLSASDDTEYVAVASDLAAKEAAGYNTTIVDPYGRLLSYQLLQGTDGGVSTRLSGLTAYSNFTSQNVPYPIITAIGVKGYQGQCVPPLNATQYEFHPYEYGSWDSGVAAFANTQYMGTALSDGKTNGTCTVHYDNLGYIFGTSSDVFYAGCAVVDASNSTSSDLENVLEDLVSVTHDPTFEDLFGIYPNPFYKYPRSTAVSSDPLLTLVDGGSTDQNNPIWPFIQPERNVDVLIVSDNSADTTDNYPNGTEIRQTYLNAQAAGLKKMPYIPDVSTFVSEGLNKRATFFGCNETGTSFIVWLPNVGYTYDSGQSTLKVEYTIPETDAMIANGVQIANQNGTAGWSFCLACGIKNKDGKALPKGCNACFEKYCYYK